MSERESSFEELLEPFTPDALEVYAAGVLDIDITQLVDDELKAVCRQARAQWERAEVLPAEITPDIAQLRLRTGEMIPPDAFEEMRFADGVLFGVRDGRVQRVFRLDVGIARILEKSWNVLREQQLLRVFQEWSQWMGELSLIRGFVFGEVKPTVVEGMSEGQLRFHQVIACLVHVPHPVACRTWLLDLVEVLQRVDGRIAQRVLVVTESARMPVLFSHAWEDGSRDLLGSGNRTSQWRRACMGVTERRTQFSLRRNQYREPLLVIAVSQSEVSGFLAGFTEGSRLGNVHRFLKYPQAFPPGSLLLVGDALILAQRLPDSK